ncbi:hypothetical protein NGA35_08365 [Pseudomonas stutzeri]|nr:hypothetical protein [Stutzerimonas stutzeri]
MDNRRAAFWLAFLGGAGVLVLIPEYFFPAPHEALLAPAGEPAAAPLAAPGGDALGPALRLSEGGADLFAAHSWRQAPPAVPVPAWTPPPPAPAPAPVAPALPFEFVGKLDDAYRLRVFLTRGDKLYTVGVGDVIDGAYRVESIAGSEMVLTYLPLDVRQTLSVGSKL